MRAARPRCTPVLGARRPQRGRDSRSRRAPLQARRGSRHRPRPRGWDVHKQPPRSLQASGDLIEKLTRVSQPPPLLFCNGVPGTQPLRHATLTALLRWARHAVRLICVSASCQRRRCTKSRLLSGPAMKQRLTIQGVLRAGSGAPRSRPEVERSSTPTPTITSSSWLWTAAGPTKPWCQIPLYSSSESGRRVPPSSPFECQKGLKTRLRISSATTVLRRRQPSHPRS